MLIKYYDEDIIGYIVLDNFKQLEILSERVERYEYIHEVPTDINDATCSYIGGYNVR